MTVVADYFAAELDLLRRTAVVFARDNPALARALQTHADDPDVERLLEGVAFLGAGLRARIERAGDELAYSLAELIAPQVVLPLPAATIVELEPNVRAMRSRSPVPRDRELRARAVEGVACVFRTCHEVDLWPLRGGAVRLVETAGDRAALEWTLELANAEALREPGALRIFLHHADLAQAATLMLWLTRHVVGISVLVGARLVGRLPPEALVAGSVARLPVFPWPETAPAAHRALLELLVMPERHCFVELAGLHALELAEGPVTLRFELRRPPPLPAALSPGCLRLHCVPAINLFEAPGEPIVRDGLAREGLVRADGVDPRLVEVHEVLAVHAIGRDRTRRVLTPFARALGRPARGTYSLRRVRSPRGDGVDTFLTVHEGPEAASTEEEVLSLRLLCTNRRLPLELRPGDIRDESPGAIVRGYANLTAVTPPAPFPTGEHARWRLLSHLALAPRGPADVASLRGLLRLYNLRPESVRGRAVERMAEAIRGVRRESVVRVVRGAPLRAVRTTIELDEPALGGPGIAFLFGHVLDDLVSAHLPLGSAGELSLALSPGQQVIGWPLRVG